MRGGLQKRPYHLTFSLPKSKQKARPVLENLKTTRHSAKAFETRPTDSNNECFFSLHLLVFNDFQRKGRLGS